ncbi:ethanolamine ammonia lyase large subunit-domain-containing protein [Blastocladiella britannica]|nr:ethanolamine ammonia lyase large subunit-domain-containing protein [Blastocladiella britannica]
MAPEDLRRLFGLANEFKEGDATQGIASTTDAERTAARMQVGLLRIGQIVPERFTPSDDPLSAYLESYSVDRAVASRIAHWTLDDLRVFLLEETREDRIREITPGLRSEVIAGVVKLMSNDELVQVAAKIWNPIGDEGGDGRLGSRGVLASRIQPNSATDDPEEVLMGILEGLSYGCGDAIFGINIVASDLENVATLEAALLDVLQTFGLEQAARHCVLAHIEEQMAVHAESHRVQMTPSLQPTDPETERTIAANATHLARTQPGSSLVRVAFQSIGGTTDINRTFGVTPESLEAHARRLVPGPTTGLYYETGQGSAVTNGAAQGIDLVTCEARAHGLARALVRRTGHWCIVNTVVGFIGPEVFKSPQQLLRACLEDLCMGKLHGLCFGLDICSTYHMGSTLEDMTHIQSAVIPAGPAFYMAVAGRNDPMLSYITTGFRDHPRLRALHGLRPTAAMRAFYQNEIGVMHADGSMDPVRAGDTARVYAAYRRRKGDERDGVALEAEGRTILARLQARGMDLGYGHDGQFRAPPAVERRLQDTYDAAKRAVRGELEPAAIQDAVRAAVAGLRVAVLETAAYDREEYLSRPTMGQVLTPVSLNALRSLARASPPPPALALPGQRVDALVVVADGLNARAVDRVAGPLVAALYSEATRRGVHVHPTVLAVRNARVRVGYQIAHEWFAPRPTTTTNATASLAAGILFLVIGERPGNGNDTVSVYQVVATPAKWARGVDHCDARVVSGISHSALQPAVAAVESFKFIDADVAAITGCAQIRGAVSDVPTTAALHAPLVKSVSSHSLQESLIKE